MILSNNTNTTQGGSRRRFLFDGFSCTFRFRPSSLIIGAHSLCNNERAAVSVLLVLAAERESMSGSEPLKLETRHDRGDRRTRGYYRHCPFFMLCFLRIMHDYAHMLADTYYAQYYACIMYAFLFMVMTAVHAQPCVLGGAAGSARALKPRPPPSTLWLSGRKLSTK